MSFPLGQKEIIFRGGLVVSFQEVSKFKSSCHEEQKLTQPMDPEKKSLNFIFPTNYVIPKSLKFGHWLSKKISRTWDSDRG